MYDQFSCFIEHYLRMHVSSSCITSTTFSIRLPTYQQIKNCTTTYLSRDNSVLCTNLQGKNVPYVVKIFWRVSFYWHLLEFLQFFRIFCSFLKSLLNFCHTSVDLFLLLSWWRFTWFQLVIIPLFWEYLLFVRYFLVYVDHS